MAKHNKISKDIVPLDFTLSLALVDALPVLFFGASSIVLGILFNSKLFTLGAVITFISGALKVLWKLIVVLKKKNIWSLFIQMRIFMPVGFLIMLLSLIIDRSKLSFNSFVSSFLSFPSVIFFMIGIIGMSLMIYFASHLDSSDLKSNWIEQLTNGIAQAAIFIGLLFLL